MTNNVELTQPIVSVLRDYLENSGKVASTENIEDAALFGEAGMLDSFGLLGFIEEVEHVIEEKFGTPISLANDRALSQRTSPYSTVRTLVEFAAAELVDSASKSA